MTILRSLKFKSTVSCVLTVLAVSTFVACGNDDNGSNNPAGAPPQSPNAQSLAAQQQQQQQEEAARQAAALAAQQQQQQEEAARQAAALAAQQQQQQEEAARQAALEVLRAPKYLSLTFSAYTTEDLLVARGATTSLTGGTRTNPGRTPVGCIKVTLNNAAMISDADVLQDLGRVAAGYRPSGSLINFQRELGTNRPIPDTYTRSLNADSAIDANTLLAAGYGDCGLSNPEARNRCVIGVLTEGMNPNVNSNWWRTDARLNATVYFNDAFDADINAARYVCESVLAGQFVQAVAAD